MNIAFYAPMKPPTDPVPSGDRLMARLFVETLERGGAAVRLASRFRTYDRGDPERQRRLADVGGRLAARLLRRWREAPADRPDLWFTYHLYHKAPDHLGPVVARELAIPYVVAEASHAPKQAGGRWDLGHRAAAAAIAAADRIYGINPVDAACLKPLVRSPDVLVDLPPFIDTQRFRLAPERRRSARAALRAEFGWPAEVPVILTVAMMREDQKRQSYAVLADALSRLGARDWRLLIVGAGPAEPAIRAMMAGFGGRVGFAGLRQDAALLDAYAAADLFAWPAIKEAVGMVFLEAAAAGLPIVAGRSGGIGHVVAEGETGIVVPAGDAEAMAAGLRRLLDAPDLAAAMAARAAPRALAVNDLGVGARRLAEDLGGLISRRNSREAR